MIELLGSISLKHFHTIIGFITMICIGALVIGGLISYLLRFFCLWSWRNNVVLTIGKIHKYFAFFILLATQVTMFAGFFLYKDKTVGLQKHDGRIDILLACINLFLFIAPLVVLEVFH